MGALEITLGIIVILLSAVIVAMVLLQSGKDKRLSGTIAGAAETFFSKGKSKDRDKKLAAATTRNSHRCSLYRGCVKDIKKRLTRAVFSFCRGRVCGATFFEESSPMTRGRSLNKRLLIPLFILQ